eukprot:CAMPEP_0113641510 /NCGR_PEP_ID=MMETSP0017_2-20120614/21791_1 /TAXON_ID=2856 /ORGANISM="Cylindrotheca closterium" /LENGTH=741 /DNA_ID=CAMNT_0000552855 /DNA_START=199 /DNA_END=2424 /DNA_ORIENTATION=- /assembly_acc=CAM_ASM_000147
MPPAILTRLSKSLRQQQKSITCHSDGKRQAEGETCPICWKNLPKKPQCLPCGHEFCKGCIVDLKEHAKTTHAIAKCPICRGPLEQESFKRVYKRACHHEHVGSTLIGLGAGVGSGSSSGLSSSGDNSLTFLTNEVIREYGLAAKKLDECLRILDATEQASSMTIGNGNKKNNSKEEAKHKQYKVATLMRLQHVLRYHILPETQYERRISLLKEAILLSPKPIPEAHLELGKIFLLEDADATRKAIGEFSTILKMAEQSRLTSGTKSARKLRGKAHYQMAMAYQDENMIREAANHYELAHKYKSCFDYFMAAKCFSLVGNLSKAIDFGKLAMQKEEEQNDPKCDTHLLLISIYEKLFLVEQLEGNLSDSKHYKYHHDIEKYCSCLIKAKNLASNSQERSELYLRMDTLQGLIPWKLATIQEHFPKAWSMAVADSANCHDRIMMRSGAFTEESPSENTYEMGEMEDSLYASSLYSTSFDYDNNANSNDDRSNDDDEDEEDSDYDDDDDEDTKDAHSDLVSDDDTGDWTDDWTQEESHDVQSVDSIMKDDDDDDEVMDSGRDDNHDNLETDHSCVMKEPETEDEEEGTVDSSDEHLEEEEDSEPETEGCMREPETDDDDESAAAQIEEGMESSAEESDHDTVDHNDKDDEDQDQLLEIDNRMKEPETDDDESAAAEIEEAMESSAEESSDHDHDTTDDEEVCLLDDDSKEEEGEEVNEDPKPDLAADDLDVDASTKEVSLIIEE